MVNVFTFVIAPGIPDIGELMLASFPTSINFIDEMSVRNAWYWCLLIAGFYPAFRWLGEKYDGVRLCWHPIQQKLYLLRFII